MRGGQNAVRKVTVLCRAGFSNWFCLGQIFAPNYTYQDAVQHYSDPEIPIGQFDEMVSVDVIKNGNDIWIVDHYSGYLIFEYNRFKEADKEAFREYEDLLTEHTIKN